MSSHGKGEYRHNTDANTYHVRPAKGRCRHDSEDTTPSRQHGLSREGPNFRSLGGLLIVNGDSILQHLCGTEEEKNVNPHEKARLGKHATEQDYFVAVSNGLQAGSQ